MFHSFSPVFRLVLAAIAIFGPMAEIHSFADDTPVPTMPAGALNVKDFGVTGDGTTDDVPALNKALAAAIAKGPGTILYLPAGTYCLGVRTLLTDNPKRGFQLSISHANDLTVEGAPGAKLVTRDLMDTIFDIEDSQKVTIRNLTCDADPLPYTQGIITGFDPATRTVEIQVDQGFDDIDRPDMQKMDQFRFYDSPYARAWKESQFFPNLVDRVRLGPGHWKLTPTPTVSGQQYQDFNAGIVGKKWMLWARGYKGWTVHIGRSDDCLVENLQIYQAGGERSLRTGQ